VIGAEDPLRAKVFRTGNRENQKIRKRL